MVPDDEAFVHLSFCFLLVYLNLFFHSEVNVVYFLFFFAIFGSARISYDLVRAPFLINLLSLSIFEHICDEQVQGTNKRDINGCAGTATRFDAASGRYVTKLDLGRTFQLKAGNLREELETAAPVPSPTTTTSDGVENKSAPHTPGAGALAGGASTAKRSRSGSRNNGNNTHNSPNALLTGKTDENAESTPAAVPPAPTSLESPTLFKSGAVSAGAGFWEQKVSARKELRVNREGNSSSSHPPRRATSLGPRPTAPPPSLSSQHPSGGGGLESEEEDEAAARALAAAVTAPKSTVGALYEQAARAKLSWPSSDNTTTAPSGGADTAAGTVGAIHSDQRPGSPPSSRGRASSRRIVRSSATAAGGAPLQGSNNKTTRPSSVPPQPSGDALSTSSSVTAAISSESSTSGSSGRTTPLPVWPPPAPEPSPSVAAAPSPNGSVRPLVRRASNNGARAPPNNGNAAPNVAAGSGVAAAASAWTTPLKVSEAG